MNRQQRRAFKADRVEMVDLRDIVMPWNMTTEDCRAVAIYRFGLNIGQTGHPTHHLTDNGAVIDCDPTLDYCLSRLTSDDRADLMERYGKEVSKAAKPAIPCNRKYYGHDPYEGH